MAGQLLLAQQLFQRERKPFLAARKGPGARKLQKPAGNAVYEREAQHEAQRYGHRAVHASRRVFAFHEPLRAVDRERYRRVNGQHREPRGQHQPVAGEQEVQKPVGQHERDGPYDKALQAGRAARGQEFAPLRGLERAPPPAVIDRELRGAEQAQREPAKARQKLRAARKQAHRVAYERREPHRAHEQAEREQQRVGEDKALPRRGVDIRELELRVGVYGPGLLLKIDVKLHLRLRADEFPARPRAELREGGEVGIVRRVEFREPRVIRDGEARLHRLAFLIVPGEGPDAPEHPAARGHVLKVRGDARVVVEGIGLNAALHALSPPKAAAMAAQFSALRSRLYSRYTTLSP